MRNATKVLDPSNRTLTFKRELTVPAQWVGEVAPCARVRIEVHGVFWGNLVYPFRWVDRVDAGVGNFSR